MKCSIEAHELDGGQEEQTYLASKMSFVGEVERERDRAS
jgi:hypothetical protein